MNPTSPSAVIFDLDGTLIDSMSHHKKSWLQFLHKYNFMITEQDFDAQNHGTIEEMIHRFFSVEQDEKKLASLCFEKEEIYRTLYQPYLKEISGVSNFLKVLKLGGTKIALATMGNQLNIDFSLDGIGIRHHFDVICGGDDVKKGKPDPEIFNLALNKLELKASECIAFEDSPAGIQSALSAGLKVVGIATTHTQEELTIMGCIHTIQNYTNFDLSRLSLSKASSW